MVLHIKRPEASSDIYWGEGKESFQDVTVRLLSSHPFCFPESVCEVFRVSVSAALLLLFVCHETLLFGVVLHLIMKMAMTNEVFWTPDFIYDSGLHEKAAEMTPAPKSNIWQQPQVLFLICRQPCYGICFTGLRVGTGVGFLGWILKADLPVGLVKTQPQDHRLPLGLWIGKPYGSGHHAVSFHWALAEVLWHHWFCGIRFLSRWASDRNLLTCLAFIPGWKRKPQSNNLLHISSWVPLKCYVSRSDLRQLLIWLLRDSCTLVI